MEPGMNEGRTSVNGMRKNYTRLRKKEKSRMRLAAVLPEALRKLQECAELRLERVVEEKLLRMSPRTMDRLLSNNRKKLSLRRPAACLLRKSRWILFQR